MREKQRWRGAFDGDTIYRLCIPTVMLGDLSVPTNDNVACQITNQLSLLSSILTPQCPFTSLLFTPALPLLPATLNPSLLD